MYWKLNVLQGYYTQWTQNILITFIQCWTSVEDLRPALYKCYKKCAIPNRFHLWIFRLDWGQVTITMTPEFWVCFKFLLLIDYIMFDRSFNHLIIRLFNHFLFIHFFVRSFILSFVSQTINQSMSYGTYAIPTLYKINFHFQRIIL